MPAKLKTTDLFLQLRCEGFQGRKKERKKRSTLTVFDHSGFIVLEPSAEDLGTRHVTEATASTYCCFHFPHTNFLIIKGPFQTDPGPIILFAAPNWRTVFVEKNRSLQSFRIKLAHQPLWEEKNYLFYPLIPNTNTIKLSFLIVTYFMLNWDKASFAQ